MDLYPVYAPELNSLNSISSGRMSLLPRKLTLTAFFSPQQIIKVLSNETFWIPLAGGFQKCFLPSVSQLSTAFKSSLKVFFKFQVIQSPVNKYNSKDHDIKGKQGKLQIISYDQKTL